MARLSHKDFDALQCTILELYEFRDANLFQQMLPKIIVKNFATDYANLCIYQINPANGAVKFAKCIETYLLIKEKAAGTTMAEDLLLDHPFSKYFMQGGEMTAVKMTDFYTLNQFRKTKFWEWDSMLHVKYNMTLPVASNEGLAGISLTSGGKDFTERDRLMLNLLQPHINQAGRNAELATARLATHARPLADYNLTPRETEIARWLAQGKSNPEIAIILQASPRTIEKHMEKILEKFGVENRTAAATMITGTKPHGHETRLS
jgi:DNA-binding CsgD family transcriptional regulator